MIVFLALPLDCGNLYSGVSSLIYSGRNFLKEMRVASPRTPFVLIEMLKSLPECNCHNKASDCYYDENIAKQKKSLDTSGQFQGGGVCIGCQQNTAGVNCETCVPGFYRPHRVSVLPSALAYH